MAKRLKAETIKSSTESIALAKTAMEPLRIPMVSFINMSIVATMLETMVAFFCNVKFISLILPICS